MTTTLSFKNGLDLPQWRPNAPAIAISVAGFGLAWDHRNDVSRLPLIFALRSATAFERL